MINKQTAKHYKWGDNCDSWIFLDNENLSVKYEAMPPSTSEKLHFHNEAQQFFYVLKGTASFTIENQKQFIKENEGIEIKAKLRHLIKNETDEVLQFLVISNPSTASDRIQVPE